MLYHDTHIRCPVCQQIHMVPGVDVESFPGCKEESIPPYSVINEVHFNLSRNVQIGGDHGARDKNSSADYMRTSVESITQAINETIHKLSGKTITKGKVLEVHNKEMSRSQTRGCTEHRANNIRITAQIAPTEHCGVHLRNETTRNDRTRQGCCTHGIDRSSSNSKRSSERNARSLEQHQSDTVNTTRKDVRVINRNAETDSIEVHRGKRSRANMQNVMKTNRVEKERSPRHSRTGETDRGRQERSRERYDSITKHKLYQGGTRRARSPRNRHNAGNNSDEPQRIRTRTCNNRGNAVVVQRETSCGSGHHQIPNVPTNESFADTCCDFLCCFFCRCTSDEEYVHI